MNTGHDQARQMLDTFASVGACSFDMTWTNAAGDKQKFRRCLTPAYLAHAVPRIIDAATADRLNVIVRPNSRKKAFVQLDDLGPRLLPHLAPVAFLTLETSPGNYQAWVALPKALNDDFARRLRKGTGADATASGATRVAGSLNFKEKHAPNYPRVMIHAAQPGRTVTAAELDRLGLAAAPEVVAQPQWPAPARASPGHRRWPSYAVCVKGAPLNSEETGPDISRADFVWCMAAITWGFTAQEAAARLMEESAKARAQGKGYAELTARNAALAVERRRHQPKRHQIG